MFSTTVRNMSDWDGVIEALLPRIQPGTILTLSGPLGAGKTTFTQLLLNKLGSKEIAKSPTFALLNQYLIPGKGSVIKRVLHVDAYRLEKEEDIRVLDLGEEMLVPGTFIVIEWPERIQEWLKRRTSAVMPMFIELVGDERVVRID